MVALLHHQSSTRKWPGTLAGDDTIVVIAPDNATAATVRARFLGMIEGQGRGWLLSRLHLPGIVPKRTPGSRVRG